MSLVTQVAALATRVAGEFSGLRSSSTAEYVLTVSGPPNAATYRLYTRATRTYTDYADTATTSGLNAALNALEGLRPTGGFRLEFGPGRYHFLDAPVGNESWAGVEDHHTFGSSNRLFEGVTFVGQGVDSTVISNRSNWSGAADTEPFSFTNSTSIAIRDLTVEACGSYKSTSDAIDIDQGSRCTVTDVLIRRSRSRAVVFDGGDDGRTARGNLVRGVVINGRPPRPNAIAYSGGSLAASTAYDYCLAWADQDLGGPGTAADTRPSDSTRLTTSSSNKQVRLLVPRAPYSVTGTKVYRRSTPDGGWVLLGTVAGNAPAVFVDDGTASTSAATFGTRSTIPQSGVELLATTDTIVTDNRIEGIGGSDASIQYGINIVRKSSVPTPALRNIVQRNSVRGTLNAGIRVSGGSWNLISENLISNPGLTGAKMNGIRIEGITGVATDRNRVLGNTILDDRDANSPEGSVGLNVGVTITATNAPTANTVELNTIVGAATSAAISDSGTGSVIRLNSGSGVTDYDSAGPSAGGSSAPAGSAFLLMGA